MHIGITGKYKLAVRRNGHLFREVEFDNLLTNLGRDNLNGVSGVTISSYCHVGTGTAVPQATDTGLQFFVAAHSGTTYPVATNSGAPSYTITQSIVYVFDQGSVVGNIAEVGIATGPTPSGSGLWSRALVTDINGNPITIDLESTDQLTVTYTLTIQRSLVGSVGSVVLAGTTYTYTSYLADQGQSATFGNVGAIFGLRKCFAYDKYYFQIYGNSVVVPSDPLTFVQTTGYVTNVGACTVDAYTPGSFTQTGSLSLQAADAVFVGGIKMISFTHGDSASASSNQRVLYIFDTPIPKTNTQQLILNFSISWS